MHASTSISGSYANRSAARRKTRIDFLYLDLDTCERCKASDANLDAALAEVSAVLQSAGAEVEVRKTRVANEQQARELRFVSSPTLRVNGKDIALDMRESRCESCSDLAGAPIECREWIFQGERCTAPPKALIVDAILRAVYGSPPAAATDPPYADVPDNLKRFFARGACCAPKCCPPP